MGGMYLLTYLRTYLLTYSIEQSRSWEANRFSASQETPRISRNLKVHYRIHKCPPPVHNHSHLDPVHTPTSHFLKIHSNILPSRPGSPKWSTSPRFPHQTLYTPILSSRRAICPANLIMLDFIARTIYGEESRSLSSSLCSFTQTLVTSPPLGPNILLNTLFSKNLSLRPSLNMSDQVSPHTKQKAEL